MHFDWTSSSRHGSSAAEVFHFWLIHILVHLDARNSIFSDVEKDNNFKWL